MNKYLKVILYIIIPLLLFNLLLSTINYFNILDNISNYLKIIILPICFFIGGYYLGNKVNKKGWFEGIKLSLGVLLLFIISIIFNGISFNKILYYLIIVITSILGSMLGINKKKK